MMKRIVCHAVLIGAFFSISPVFCQIHSPTAMQAVGSIAGSVQNANGTPVANVAVSVNIRPTSGGSFQPFNTVVTTTSDGTFSVPRVPNGKFAVCPAAPGTSLLAPCMWGSELTVTVINGQTVTMPTVKLQPGVDFYVRVNDPHGKLAANLGKTPGASLTLAVRSPNGMVAPIPVTASDAAGFDYHLSVPSGTDLLFVASSGSFSMADAAGAAISPQAGLSQTINIPAGQSQYKQTITIN